LATDNIASSSINYSCGTGSFFVATAQKLAQRHDITGTRGDKSAIIQTTGLGAMEFDIVRCRTEAVWIVIHRFKAGSANATQ
jgi:hypothetical protein